MPRSTEQLRDDALRIWRAGVEAVDSQRLVRRSFRVEGRRLQVGDASIELDPIGRIAVVGAGKAGAGMAAAVEVILGDDLLHEKQVAGWVNVPAGCERPLARIHLHPARPAGVNEPTPAGVVGAERILDLVASLRAGDLCLCLISGGGSALMPAPVEGITLDDKLAVTRHLSSSGANIEQLNAVRKQLSRIKGGGLARACRAGRLVSLIISDVLGDPLDVIASGPTVPDTSTPQMALDVLREFGARRAGIDARVFDYLEQKGRQPQAQPACQVTNWIIGSNATAVDAAGAAAERLGYQPAMAAAAESEGLAEDVGRDLAQRALRMRSERGPNCLVSGGEPVVRLIEPERRGLGGRNQQLVLAALQTLLAAGGADRIALLSGGTDGEDGPTDAAGAMLDASILATAKTKGLDPADYLRRNDAYHFFGPLGGLIMTGPTHTNVCDLRVVVVDQDG
jgi:glycerate 2-kinase